MDDQSRRIDEDRAKAIWLRAAELQAEAAQQVEERSRALAPGDGDDSGDGLTSDVVRAAAIEAGISPEFIDLALAENQGGVSQDKQLEGWKDRAATRLLGTDVRRMDVKRTISAPPEQVLDAMQKVFPNHPYHLTLRDTIGENPLDGAVLVFEVPGMTGGFYTSFTYRMSISDLKELRLVLRPRDEGQRTDVTVNIPLGRSRKINWMAGHALPGGGALLGGIGGVITAKVAALTGALVAAPIAAGALGMAAVGHWGMRAAYRGGLRKGREEVEALLKSVEVTCRLGTGFFPSPPATSQGGGIDLSGLLGS